MDTQRFSMKDQSNNIYIYIYIYINEALDKEPMDAKRKHWLQFHDQKTSGIMGLCPLVKGMPVRLTGHINRDLGLYKTTKCTIHSWSLNANEARASFSLLAGC